MSDRPSLPTVADLAAVPVADVPALLTHLAALQSALAARLVTVPTAPVAPPDTLLDVKAAAALLAVTPDWLRRRHATLPFVVKLTSGAVRYSKDGIAAFIAQHYRNT